MPFIHFYEWKKYIYIYIYYCSLLVISDSWGHISNIVYKMYNLENLGKGMITTILLPAMGKL